MVLLNSFTVWTSSFSHHGMSSRYREAMVDPDSKSGIKDKSVQDINPKKTNRLHIVSVNDQITTGSISSCQERCGPRTDKDNGRLKDHLRGKITL